MALRPNFIGTYQNLDGVKIGDFNISGPVGTRSAAKAPRWLVVCGRCGSEQIIEHSRLQPMVQSGIAPTSLQCTDPQCKLSRLHYESDSLADRRLRRQEFEAAIAERQRAEGGQTAKDRQEAARMYEIQRQYSRFGTHQIRAGMAVSRLCGFKRWFELSDSRRAQVLEAIEKEPGLVIENL